MINVIKPFKVLDIKEEQDGGQGVTFEVSKTEYLSQSKTRTLKMTSYISIPANEDVDTFLFNFLSDGGWL